MRPERATDHERQAIMSVTTFAAIDVGSYNVSLEIFEFNKKTGIKPLTRVRQSLELGRDTFALRKISPAKLDELIKILFDYRRIMKEFGVTDYRACAKSAFREATNCQLAVSHIYRSTGIKIDVLSNSEQRFLGYKSIASKGEEFQKCIEKGTAIIDIGGGSIQISLFDKDALVTTQNIPLGTLRIRQRLAELEKETVRYDQLVEEFIRRDIKDFRKMFLKNRKIDNIILVGDYFTNLIFHNKNDSSVIATRSEFIKWYEHVSRSTLREVAAELGISSDMSSIIIPTAVLYMSLIEELRVESIWLPGIQLTDGIAYDYAEKKRYIRSSHDFDKDIVMAARNISRRYAGNKAHADIMVDVSTAIFDAIRKYADLDGRMRLLLEVACHLHDCGKYISLSDVAESSYNIIRATEIIGLSERERRVIALAVKLYNGTAEEFTRADGSYPEEFMIASQLAVIMRIAGGLDRSYTGKIASFKAVRKDRELILSAVSAEDFTLESGMFRKDVPVFEEIFNIRPVLKMKRKG